MSRHLAVLALLLTACVPDPEDCLPTFGDQCSCDPQCLTQHQINSIHRFCDLDCEVDLDWDCTVADGQCAVAP